MQNFELRIGLARCGHCTSRHRAALFTLHFTLFTSRRDALHFPQGPLFTFHSSLFTCLTQCGASGIATRCIGHRSALHRPLQCDAFFGALSCTVRNTPPGSLLQKTENKNAARWDTPHSIVCLTLLSCLPSLLKPIRGRRVFRSDLFTTAPAFLRVSFPIPRELPWAASSMLLPHPLEQGV